MKKTLLDKISFNFIEQKKILFLDFLNTRQKKKKKVESSSFIKLSKFDGLMSFLKTYYDINEQAFFTTEVKGICNEE